MIIIKKNQKNILMDEFKFHSMILFGALNCHVWLGIDLSHELLMNIARFLAHAKEKKILASLRTVCACIDTVCWCIAHQTGSELSII